MKKLFSIFLILLLCMAVLSGCSTTTNDTTDNNDNDQGVNLPSDSGDEDLEGIPQPPALPEE